MEIEDTIPQAMQISTIPSVTRHPPGRFPSSRDKPLVVYPDPLSKTEMFFHPGADRNHPVGREPRILREKERLPEVLSEAGFLPVVVAGKKVK